MNTYETIKELAKSQQHFQNFAGLETTLPHVADANRTVKSNDERGSTMWGVKVASSKPEIYITMRDNKTHDSETDSFDWTAFVVSVYRNGGFELVNNPFKARLTRSLYNQLVESGCCTPDADLSKSVVVDFSGISAFPEKIFDSEYLGDKISLLAMQANLKTLRYLKSQALAYFQKTGVEFDGLPAKTVRVSHPDWVNVQVPVTTYTVEIKGVEITSNVDMNLYRVKVGRSYVYTPENYFALVAAIKTLKEQVDSLAQTVRVAELGALEHCGTEAVSIGAVTIHPTVTNTFETKRCSIQDAEAFLVSHPDAILEVV